MKKIIFFAYPDGNWSIFKFHPILVNSEARRKMSKTLDPMAITLVAGWPNTNIPGSFCRLKNNTFVL